MEDIAGFRHVEPDLRYCENLWFPSQEPLRQFFSAVSMSEVKWTNIGNMDALVCPILVKFNKNTLTKQLLCILLLPF